MAGEVDERAWEELSRAVQGELAAGRRGNPRATLGEIAAATDAALRRRQARCGEPERGPGGDAPRGAPALP